MAKKKIIEIIKKIIKYPPRILIYLDMKRIITLKDDVYLKLLYKSVTNKNLNLQNPETFNEKLQWLKLYDRNPEYTKMVDKYEVKKYITNVIDEKYIIPTIGVWDNFDDIDFNKIPNQFVIKCTHDSGGIYICKNKENFNKEEAKKIINKCLKRNYYYYSREWPYKYVKPRIIIEKYMSDESNYELKDYKFFCFNGIPKFVQVDFDRFSNHKRNIYSLEWKLLNFEIEFPSDKHKKIEKPINFEKMIELARLLSKDIPHIRVDFYSINEKIYFGELTFYHGAGLEKFTPNEYDKILGNWINLPNKI